MGNTKSTIGEDLIIKGVEKDDLNLIKNGIECGVDFDKRVNGAPFVYQIMMLAITKKKDIFNSYLDMFEKHFGYVHRIKEPLCISIYLNKKRSNKDYYYCRYHTDKYHFITFLKFRLYFGKNRVYELEGNYCKMKTYQLVHHKNIKDVLYFLLLHFKDLIHSQLKYLVDKSKYEEDNHIFDYYDIILSNVESLKNRIIKRENEDSDDVETVDAVPINDDTLCSICMDNKKNILLRPCKHLCICDSCNKYLEKCPLCRTNISSTEKVYC